MSLIELHYKEVEEYEENLYENGVIKIGNTTIQLEPLEEWAECFNEDLQAIVWKAIEKAMDNEIESDWRNWE